MRRHLRPASFLLLLIGLAGCAHQNAGGGGYAGMAYGDCEFGGDCYGPDTTQYSCVFYQAPVMPARLAITGTRHHPAPRLVNRGDPRPGSPPMESSGSSSASVSAPAPAVSMPISREPVVLASPSGESRTPRTPN
jgi:hypothetical protein